MFALNEPSAFPQQTIIEVSNAHRAYRAAGILTDEHDDAVQILILLCETAYGNRAHSDYTALIYELTEASKAFLAQDFPEFLRHYTEAVKWQHAITQDEREEGKRQFKTPVR